MKIPPQTLIIVSERLRLYSVYKYVYIYTKHKILIKEIESHLYLLSKNKALKCTFLKEL